LSRTHKKGRRGKMKKQSSSWTICKKKNERFFHTSSGLSGRRGAVHTLEVKQGAISGRRGKNCKKEGKGTKALCSNRVR